jgi:hypothetical protein
MIDEDISALYLCRQVNWLSPNWFANSIVFHALNQNLNGKGVLSLKGEVFNWFFNQNGVALIVLQKQHWI